MRKNFICWTDDMKQDTYHFLNSENKIELSKLHQISIAINSAYAIFDNQLLAWTPRTENLYDGSFDFLQSNPIKFENRVDFGKRKVSKIFCNNQICHSITEEGLIFSWGVDRDKTGILGLGDNYNQPTPVLNENFKEKRVTALSISEKHAFAIDNRHRAYAWGSGYCGELGLKGITRTNVPIEVDKGNVLPMSIKCGMNYTMIINYEAIPYYYGVIDTFNPSANDIEIKSSLEQLTHYGNYDTNQETGIKSIPFDSPYRIDNIYCGDSMIALIDLIGGLYLYSEKEGLNRVKIPMAIKSVKFINSRIYALTKQSDFLFEFVSRGGEPCYLDEYIEILYSVNGREYDNVNIIDTPYYDKALFFSVECTNVSKSKAEKEVGAIFTIMKTSQSQTDIYTSNEGRHNRYNSALTTNNNDSSRLTIKLNTQSQSNLYYHSGNISPNPSQMTAHSFMNKQDNSNRSSSNKFLSSNPNVASMPDIKVKAASSNGNNRIGRISSLLSHIFDRKIDSIANTSNASPYSKEKYLFAGKKRIELERIYPGYCYTRDGLFVSTENSCHYPHKRASSQTSREACGSNSNRKYLRTVSQDRYVNNQEVNIMLKRAKKEDEYIDSIRNDQVYTSDNDRCNYKAYQDNHCNENEYEDNTDNIAKALEREINEFITPSESKTNSWNDEKEAIKSKGILKNSKEVKEIKVISTTMNERKKDKAKESSQCNATKSQSIKEKCKEMQKQMKDDFTKLKTKDIAKFLTIKESHSTKSISTIKSDDKEGVGLKEKPQSKRNVKLKEQTNRSNYQCEVIEENNETEKSQREKKVNLVTVKDDPPNNHLVLYIKSKCQLQEVTNLYIMSHCKLKEKEEEKEKEPQAKPINRSKSALLISKPNSIKEKEATSISKEAQNAPQELYPITVYKKPIKISSQHSKAKVASINKEKERNELNSQPLIVSDHFNDNMNNYSKETQLKSIEKHKEDDSELNEALFSYDDALNNLSTKRQSKELSSNNNKQAYSDKNNLLIEHIDLTNITIKQSNSSVLSNKDTANVNINSSFIKKLNSNRNIKSPPSSPTASIAPTTTQNASSIYQHLLTKSKVLTKDTYQEPNSIIKGMEYTSVKGTNNLYKRSSSMASIRPNAGSKNTSLAVSLKNDTNQRNKEHKMFYYENSKIDSEVHSLTNLPSSCKASIIQAKDKPCSNNDSAQPNKESLSNNKTYPSLKANTPIKLVNVQKVKGESNIKTHTTALTKKKLSERPSFASSRPKIIEKVKNGQLTKANSKSVLTPKTSSIGGNNSYTTLGYNNTFETKDSSSLKRQKSSGNISRHHSSLMTQERRNHPTDSSSYHQRHHSHDSKVIVKRDLGKTYSTDQLRDNYFKYLGRVYDNDQNKVINHLLSPKGSNDDLSKEFFKNAINSKGSAYSNQDELLTHYQHFNEEMRNYINGNLDSFKLVQVKEQMENHNSNDNQYIAEVTKTNNLITLEYDDKRSNASYYEPLELEKSVRSTIRHSIDRTARIIQTTDVWLDRPATRLNSNRVHLNSTRLSPRKDKVTMRFKGLNY